MKEQYPPLVSRFEKDHHLSLLRFAALYVIARRRHANAMAEEKSPARRITRQGKADMSAQGSHAPECKKPAFAGFVHSYSENDRNIYPLVHFRQSIYFLSAMTPCAVKIGSSRSMALCSMTRRWFLIVHDARRYVV